jgi:hypothetical protein
VARKQILPHSAWVPFICNSTGAGVYFNRRAGHIAEVDVPFDRSDVEMTTPNICQQHSPAESFNVEIGITEIGCFDRTGRGLQNDIAAQPLCAQDTVR